MKISKLLVCTIALISSAQAVDQCSADADCHSNLLDHKCCAQPYPNPDKCVFSCPTYADAKYEKTTEGILAGFDKAALGVKDNTCAVDNLAS